MFQRTELPGGPRVISARLPGVRSVAVAAYVPAGSRLETREHSGVAHFLEHLTFKGTERYPDTRLVSEAVEAIGGTSNAATDRESTVYWVRVPARDAERGVDVVAELVQRPLLRDEDIDKERDVIVEEIRSYRDDPGQRIYTVFDETFYGDTSLGWEIAGDETTVRSLPPDVIRGFWATHYTPASTVVAVAGALEHDEAVSLVRSAFRPATTERNGVAPFPAAPPLPNGARVRWDKAPGSQAHLCLGVPALPRDHPDTWTLELLDTVLGACSSSRLFLKVREEQGLAYDVHSFATDHADCGALQVYAGVDPDDLVPALESIVGELARLRDEPVPDAEVEKARAYAGGRLELRLEETRHLVSWIGTQEALHEQVLTLDDALEALARVTPADIQTLAQRLFRDDALALAVVAPGRPVRALERTLRL